MYHITLSQLLASPKSSRTDIQISGRFRGAVAPPPAISGHTKGWMCCYKNTLKHTNSCK